MQLEKPWDVSRVHHLTLSRAYNTYKPSRWENPSLLHQYVDAKSAYQFHVSIFVPSFTYPFPTNTIPGRATYHSTNALSAPSCPEWGSPGITHEPFCMAPSPSAELAFDHSTMSKDRPTVLKHSRSSTMVATQLHIALARCQRHVGISTPILEFTATTLPHLETSFSSGLTTYLASTKSTLILEKLSRHASSTNRRLPLNGPRPAKVIISPTDKSDKSTTAVSSSKFTPVSDLAAAFGTHILTSPSSEVSPVSSPTNQQTSKTVRTPPPHGQFGGRLVSCGAIQSRKICIDH
jgi:hypothetical protein